MPDDWLPILSQLLKSEMAEGEVRSIADHMNAARFPACKDLPGVNSIDARSWMRPKMWC